MGGRLLARRLEAGVGWERGRGEREGPGGGREVQVREGEEAGEWLLQEIRRGETTRTVTLPSGLEADKASASFENGMLTLRIPRAEAVKPRRIRIDTTSGKAIDAATERPSGERERSDGHAGPVPVGSGSSR